MILSGTGDCFGAPVRRTDCMTMTPDAVRRVLRSWVAIEVLTPQVTKDGWSGLAAERQGQQRNKGNVMPDDPGQWELPEDEAAPPWPLLAERPTEDKELVASSLERAVLD